MKIRKAPVADLMKYVGELYANRENNLHDSIFSLINDYYCSLTNYKDITPISEDYLNDWCDLNWSKTMDNCPNVPGLIIYKNNPNGTKTYGLMYHSGYVVSRLRQTDYMSYYDIDRHGHIASHSYLQSDWDGWGAPVRFFSFPPEDYQDSSVWALGERSLKLHCFGHDVRQLQSLLHKAAPDTPLHGYFDNDTLDALNMVRSWYNIPQSETFSATTKDGEKLILFLADENHS